MNQDKDEESFDRKMVALAKQEELKKFEKLKVYDVVKEEESRNDPRAIKNPHQVDRDQNQNDDQGPICGKGVRGWHQEGRVASRNARSPNIEAFGLQARH